MASPPRASGSFRLALAGLALLLAGLAALGALSATGRVREEEALRRSLTLAHGVLWAQASLQNYLAAGDPAYLAEHRDALQEVADAAAGLVRADRALAVPASLLGASARELAARVEDWKTGFASPALAFRKAAASAKLGALTRKGVGARLARGMADGLADLKAHLDQTLALHAQALATRRWTAAAAAAAGGVMFLWGGTVALRHRAEEAEELRASAERAAAQAEFAEKLHALSSADQVARQLAVVLGRRAPHAAVVLKDEDGPGMRVAASVGEAPPGAAASPLLAEPLKCPVIGTGHRFSVGDVARDAPCDCPLGVPRRGGYACAPLLARGRVVGVASWKSPEHRPLTAGAREEGEGFARIASLALSSLTRLNEAQREAVTDALTGLANRRFLDTFLEKQALAARREGRPLAVLMLDLDRFKGFNDRFGHPAGDALLRETARAVSAAVRDGDLVARYGGEEFTVVLPGATREVAAEIGARVRTSVAGIALAGLVPPPVTVSAGLALAPDHGTKGAELLRAADAALYRAKEEGRDRLVIAT